MNIFIEPELLGYAPSVIQVVSFMLGVFSELHEVEWRSYRRPYKSVMEFGGIPLMSTITPL